MREPLLLYEDQQIAVLEKPTELVVTPGPGHPESETLVSWLLERYGEGLRQVGSGAHRPGIVHRLDKQTSGVLVIAKTQPAFESLVQQFKAREVEKQYLLVVWGKLSEPEFIIQAPVGRNPNDRRRFAVTQDGKSAKTRYRLDSVTNLKKLNFSTLLAFPKTGRTHQIRVHIKSFGHSVLGDPHYQSRKEHQRFAKLTANGIIKDRMYLHARRIKFKHPASGKIKTFESPVPTAFNPFIRPN